MVGGTADGLSREARLLIEGRDGEKERQKDTLRETQRERGCVCVCDREARHGSGRRSEAKAKAKLRTIRRTSFFLFLFFSLFRPLKLNSYVKAVRSLALTQVVGTPGSAASTA